MAAPARGHELCSPVGAPTGLIVPPAADDWDCDFVKDDVDNCPPTGYDDLTHRNPNQANSDNDALGDWCDNDDDNDGVLDWADGGFDYQPNRVKKDNCRTIANPLQTDDRAPLGVGDDCEFDNDGDGIVDTDDNCRERANPDQADMDGDRNGDVCDNDLDGDYVRNSVDNCPTLTNPQVPPDWKQPDADGDGIGTACDPFEPLPTPAPPSATPVPTATPAPPVINDGQAPRVSVRIASTQRRDEIEGGLVVRVTCSEACAIKSDLVADKKVAKRLKLGRSSLVASGTAKVDGAGTTYAFVRISARTRRTLFKSKRTTLTLRVAATDPAGNTRRVSERLVLAR